jgi:hypothetical protein
LPDNLLVVRVGPQELIGGLHLRLLSVRSEASVLWSELLVVYILFLDDFNLFLDAQSGVLLFENWLLRKGQTGLLLQRRRASSL